MAGSSSAMTKEMVDSIRAKSALACGEGQLEERQQGRKGRVFLGKNVVAVDPGAVGGVVAGDTLARFPDAAHRDQRLVELHLAVVVAADRVVNIDPAGRFGDDLRLLEQLAHRSFGDRLAQFKHAAGKAP